MSYRACGHARITNSSSTRTLTSRRTWSPPELAKAGAMWLAFVGRAGGGYPQAVTLEETAAGSVDGSFPVSGLRLSYVIARLDRAVRGAIAECLAPFGLTIPQFTTLSVLLRRGGLSNAQLARRSYITPQSMHDVVLELERRGLVCRTPDPAHRKILRTALTAEGRRVVGRCEAAVAAMEDEMLSDFGPGARERLIHELAVCVRALGGGLPDL
jgi:DNA-binding MarR family transcriptional regulator